MEWFTNLWAWASSNPGAALWAAFAFLTGLVALYKSKEVELKAYVESTDPEWDNKIVAWVSKVLGGLAVVLDIVAMFVPRFASQPGKKKENK